MNISIKNNDAASSIITMGIVKADYEELVDKSLRSYRQKADMPGFRKGMVPMGMIKKMYGKHLLVDEINKLVSENLYKYIRENDLNILGDPIPNETEQKTIDFDKQEDFEFCFDVALAPAIQIDLSKKDQFDFYQVAIDDAMINRQIESYRTNFGTYDPAEDVAEGDLVKGTLTELENGVAKEGGIVVEEATLMPMYLNGEAEKAKLIGAKVGDTVVFNPNAAYGGALWELASFFKMEKDQVAGILSDFNFKITESTRHSMTEINQEFFDKVLGEGAATNEEEFRNKIKDTVAEQFTPQSNFKFLTDAREKLVEKAGELAFADELIKRWLTATNEKNTPEKIEAEYPQIKKDLTYHLIKESLVKANDLKVEENDVQELAKRVAKAQFVQYGMLSVPDDALDNYAKQMMQNKETAQNIVERVIEEKLSDFLKEKVTLVVKEISAEDFNHLFDQQQEPEQ